MICLTLCTTCHPDATAENLRSLRAALDAEGLVVQVRGQDCLNLCGEPLAMALQGDGRATCLFAGVDLPADTADVLATIRAYAKAPAGWIEDARPCGRLRHCLKGRVRAFPAP